MIDKNGNKIVPREDKKDINFLLAEARFFTKGFIKHKNDQAALLIAENINKFLTEKGSVSQITEMLSELESYAPNSDSHDFLWELVYIRRRIAASRGSTISSMKFAAKHRGIAAEHFDLICKMIPTVHNRCCRILEHIAVASNLLDSQSNDKETLDQISRSLDDAGKFLEEIKKSELPIYFLAGKDLYQTKLAYQKITNAPEDEIFGVLKNWVLYSRGLYKSERTRENLTDLAESFLEYSSNASFSYAEEKENLCELLRWLDAAIESKQIGNGLYRFKLRSLRIKLKAINP